MKVHSFSVEQTEAFGAQYAKGLQAGDVITLDGDLGAGKTAFVRGVLCGLGYRGRVTSPTFAIANEYRADGVCVVHFDMYRIVGTQALLELGFEEYLDGVRIVLIEWSSNIQDTLPAQYKTVCIAYGTVQDSRTITMGEVTA